MKLLSDLWSLDFYSLNLDFVGIEIKIYKIGRKFLSNVHLFFLVLRLSPLPNIVIIFSYEYVMRFAGDVMNN